MSLYRLKINKRSYYDLPNSAFWGWLSMESWPQNLEFRNEPETFHPCVWQYPEIDRFSWKVSLDFLWKVSPKIWNSGIILKTFMHAILRRLEHWSCVWRLPTNKLLKMLLYQTTVLPAKSDSYVMFCLQRYQGLIIDRSLVYYRNPIHRINTQVIYQFVLAQVECTG